MAANQRRKPIHLPAYDYRTPGPYFVTICTNERVPLFGRIDAGEFQPNPAGAMVAGAWEDIPTTFPEVTIWSFVTMPNHIHGVLMLDPGTVDRNASLGDIVRWYKSITTNRYIHGVRSFGWPPFPGKVWQPRYYEHIVRNDADMDRILTYIENNPATWNSDSLYMA
jgi:putative transposase